MIVLHDREEIKTWLLENACTSLCKTAFMETPFSKQSNNASVAVWFVVVEIPREGELQTFKTQ